MKVQLVYGKRIKHMTPTEDNQNYNNDDDEDVGLPACIATIILIAFGVPGACLILIWLAFLLD